MMTYFCCSLSLNSLLRLDRISFPSLDVEIVFYDPQVMQPGIIFYREANSGTPCTRAEINSARLEVTD